MIFVCTPRSFLRVRTASLSFESRCEHARSRTKLEALVERRAPEQALHTTRGENFALSFVLSCRRARRHPHRPFSIFFHLGPISRRYVKSLTTLGRPKTLCTGALEAFWTVDRGSTLETSPTVCRRTPDSGVERTRKLDPCGLWQHFPSRSALVAVPLTSVDVGCPVPSGDGFVLRDSAE